jgi:hypothetical protein
MVKFPDENIICLFQYLGLEFTITERNESTHSNVVRISSSISLSNKFNKTNGSDSENETNSLCSENSVPGSSKTLKLRASDAQVYQLALYQIFTFYILSILSLYQSDPAFVDHNSTESKSCIELK